MEIRKGIGVSPGYVVEKVFILDTEHFFIPKRTIDVNHVKSEIARLKEAIASAVEEIIKVQKKFSQSVDSQTASIFDAHISMIEDKKIQEEIIKRIRDDRVTPEYAVSRVFRRYVKLLSEIKEGYLQQRASDLLDNETRLLRHLLGKRRQSLESLNEKVVIVAHDLTPSQTALLNPEYVLGLAIDLEGPTSHTAIMAKAMKVPCVVGLKDLSTNISGGDMLALDGAQGVVITSPDPATCKMYREKTVRYHEFEKQLVFETKDLEAVTLDEVPVELMLNIEDPHELDRSGDSNYPVGLFRTEFLAMLQESPLDESSHYDAYVHCLSHLNGSSLTVRTLDLGGDKKNHYDLGVKKEPNPILGCRSIRLSFEQPSIFRAQLRACLRAALHGPIKILFPLVSSIDEIRKARQFLEDVSDELKEKGIPFGQDVEVGMMVEVPSAALMIDHFVDEADFFSIGSNDLVQYILAVDRTNERVANLYKPSHPALLRLIKNVIDVCGKANKPVVLCGEMAGDLRFTELLLGLGLRRFSMLAAAIPEIKKMIRSLDTKEAKNLADRVLAMKDPQSIYNILENRAQKIMPITF